MTARKAAVAWLRLAAITTVALVAFGWYVLAVEDRQAARDMSDDNPTVTYPEPLPFVPLTAAERRLYRDCVPLAHYGRRHSGAPPFVVVKATLYPNREATVMRFVEAARFGDDLSIRRACDRRDLP